MVRLTDLKPGFLFLGQLGKKGEADNKAEMAATLNGLSRPIRVLLKGDSLGDRKIKTR